MATKNAVGKTDIASSGANSDISSLNTLSGSILTPSDITLANNGTIDAGTGVGNAYKLRARATTGGTWVDLIVLTNAALAPTLDFPTGFTWNGGVIPLTAGGTNAATAQAALTSLQSWNTVWKTADETLTNSNTLQDDNHLTFSVAAGKNYAFRLHIHYSTTASGDFKWDLNYSQTAQRASYSYNQIIPGATAGVNALGSGILTAFGSSTSAAGTVGGDGNLFIEGTFKAHATNAGTLTFRWAQNTQTNDAGINVYAGGWIEYRQVD